MVKICVVGNRCREFLGELRKDLALGSWSADIKQWRGSRTNLGEIFQFLKYDLSLRRVIGILA